MRKDILQPDQLRVLFSEQEEWYCFAWQFMAATGMRPGEVYGLKWSDIDGSILHIRRSLNDRGIITQGKNENAIRTFVLAPTVMDILSAQKERTEALKSVWVFPDNTGAPSQRKAYKAWKSFAEKKDIKEPPYAFRRTFISIVKNAMPAEMVKALVGHSESMDTFGVYGRPVNGEMEESAKIVDITVKRVLER